MRRLAGESEMGEAALSNRGIEAPYVGAAMQVPACYRSQAFRMATYQANLSGCDVAGG